MKAAIISMGSVSSKLTHEAMQQYFDDVEEIDIRDLEVNISGTPSVLVGDTPIKEYDCIYAKGSYRFAMTLRAITDVIRSRGKPVYMPFEPDTHTNGHDKILTHLKLLHNKVPTPMTYVASSPEAGKHILQNMNYPVILKIPSGTQGKGVMFVDSFEAASSMLDTLTTLRQPFLIQEYIETGSTDIRVIVVGNKVVAAMKRIGKKDDKRSNIHAGGVGEPIIPSEEVKRIAIKATQAMGADICGVDILDSSYKGPLVIEVNLSPGLQGIQKSTSIDVAEEIAQYLAERTKDMLDAGKKQNSKDVMVDLDASKQNRVCILTNLQARGSKLILPEIAYKLSKINDETEVELCVEQGRIEISKTTQ